MRKINLKIDINVEIKKIGKSSLSKYVFLYTNLYSAVGNLWLLCDKLYWNCMKTP